MEEQDQLLATKMTNETTGMGVPDPPKLESSASPALAPVPNPDTSPPPSTSTTATTSSPALLDKILSRVKMLGRVRASRTSASDSGVPVRSSVPKAGSGMTSDDPRRDLESGPAPRRTASETGALAVNSAVCGSDSQSILLSTASSGYK